MQDLHWHNIWHADNPVEVLNEHLSLLVRRYVPTKVIRVRNKDKHWFDDQCMQACFWPQAGGSYLVEELFGGTGKSLSAVK